MSSPNATPAPNQGREAALVTLALAKNPAERLEFLNRECSGDPALRTRVEAALAASLSPDTLPASGPLPRAPGTEPPSTVPAPAPTPGTLPPDGAIGQTLGPRNRQGVGRYKLLEKLGEGGCGVVYVAEQSEPVRRRVALKVIKLGMDTKAVVARFEAERQALAMMDHPNIAKVLDAGVAGESSESRDQTSAAEAADPHTSELRPLTSGSGRPYFVMELVRGIRITDYCDQHHLTTRDRLDLFIKVCHAIQHAHQKGIIHRDIKPSNILVTLHDGVPVPKVIDFGIAKATEGRLTDATVYTQLHQFIGTPAYMSPEQAEMSGLDIDTRSDIYSLGVLLYELLTGRTPFDAEQLLAQGLDAMRRTIRETEPARPSTRLATLQGDELTTAARRRSVEPPKLIHLLQGDLDWIAMKCLEKDRTRRYETANGLAADLKRHLDNEPVIARPPSAAYRLQKSLRRNKLAFAATGSVVAALVAGLGVSLWQYAGKSRAEQEQARLRNRAEAKAREASEARTIAAQQRDLANERLYDSLVREARSIRQTRQLGYRQDVFDRLRQAHSLPTRNHNPSQLRNEAAACFGDWVGLNPVDVSVPNGIFTAAISPDGAIAALVPDGDSPVALHDTRSGEKLGELNLPGASVIGLTFDPQGRTLFAAVLEEPFRGERPKALRIEHWSSRARGHWQPDGFQRIAGCFHLETTADSVVAVSVSQDDSSLALLDATLGSEWAKLPLQHPLPPHPFAALTADRRHIAFFSRETTNSFDAQIEIWDLQPPTRRFLLRPKLGVGHGLTFGPDGTTLAAVFENNLVTFDTRDSSRIFNTEGAFGTYRPAIAGSDSLAFPLPQEYEFRLVRLHTGRESLLLKVPGIALGQWFSKDGSVLLLTHALGARFVRLTAETEIQRFPGHQGGVPAVEFSPDGYQLASIGKDRTLRLWDLKSPGTSRILGTLPAPGQTLAFTPDGHYLLCGYYNIGELSLWSVQDARLIGRIREDPRHPDTTWAVNLSPDGKYFAAIGSGFRIWDLQQLLASTSIDGSSATPLREGTNGVSGIQFSPHKPVAAFVSIVSNSPFRTAIQGVDFSRQAPPTILATNSQDNIVQGLSFLPQNGHLAYVTQTRDVAVLEPEHWSEVRRFPASDPDAATQSAVGNLRVSPDGTRLAMVSNVKFGVDIREPGTGRLLYTLPGEAGSIWWLAWSPDSQHLAVTRSNGEIAVWDLRAIERQLAAIGLEP